MSPFEEKREQIRKLEEQRHRLLWQISDLTQDIDSIAEHYVGKCFRDIDNLLVVGRYYCSGDKSGRSAHFLCTRVLAEIEDEEGIFQCEFSEDKLLELEEISLEEARELFWENCNTFARTLFGEE